MRKLVTISSILGISLSLFMTASVALAQLAPVIDHQYRFDINILLEVSALEVEITRIASDQEANDIFQGLNSRRSFQRGGRAGGNLQNSYLEAASLVHYYLLNSSQSSEFKARLQQARAWLLDGTKLYMDRPESERGELMARYYHTLAKFGSDDERGSAVAALVDLREALSDEPKYQVNVDLLLANALITVQATRTQGRRYMRQVSGASVYGNLANRLMQALVAANIDGEGRVLGQASADGMKNLNYVTQVARGLPRGLQEPIFGTILFIWRHAYQEQYPRPPFSLEGLIGISAVDSYLERRALNLFAAGQVSAALASYQSIADGYKGSSLEITLMQRIWQMELDTYKRTAHASSIEARFMSLHERFANPREGSSRYLQEASQFYRNVRSQYRRFVMQGLQEALAASELDQGLTELVGRYLKLETGRRASFPIKQRLAQVYRKFAQHQEAVEIYLDLAQDIPIPAYTAAIESQRVLSTWPAEPPWQHLPAKGRLEERAKLLEIYEKLSAQKKHEDWALLAHIGLLQLSLDRRTAMETSWLTRLPKAPANVHSQEAAGRLLKNFYQQRRWVEVIQLASLVKQRSLAPTDAMQPLAVEPLLADALFLQAQDDLKNRKHNEAIGHLNQFVQNFQRDQRLPVAYQNLAIALHAAGRLIPALNVMKLIVDRFPKLESRGQVMLTGGQWADGQQNTMEFAFFFYSRYLRDFPSTANIAQVREHLAGLYYERKLYGWASRLYRDQSLANGVPQNLALNAALRHMDIEAKYGQPKDAALGAQRALQLAAPKSQPAVRAQAFLASYAAKRGDLVAMRAMEPQLVQASSQFPEGREALGEIRFKMAEMQTRPISNQEANAFLRDPEAAVKSYFEAFEREKQHYQKVCQDGVNSFCAPALMRLVQLSQMAAEAIRKVEIAETLGAERVNAFRVFKQLHLSKINEQERIFGRDSIRLAQQGTTSSLWRSEILKTLGEQRYHAAH